MAHYLNIVLKSIRVLLEKWLDNFCSELPYQYSMLTNGLITSLVNFHIHIQMLG